MTAVGEALASNCSISAPSPGPFTPEVNGSHPQPQEVIQYFRASSLALTRKCSLLTHTLLSLTRPPQLMAIITPQRCRSKTLPIAPCPLD
jgi:hypothetical protein